jgi:hypothetical protein
MSESVGSRGGGARKDRFRGAPVQVILSRMVDGSLIRERYAAVSRDLNERARRLFGTAEARTAGHGGVAGNGSRAQYDRPRAEGSGRPRFAGGQGSAARQRPPSFDIERYDAA